MVGVVAIWLRRLFRDLTSLMAEEFTGDSADTFFSSRSPKTGRSSGPADPSRPGPPDAWVARRDYYVIAGTATSRPPRRINPLIYLVPERGFEPPTY